MDLQTILVAALALAAAGFVGRKVLRQFKGQEEPGCDKCPPGAAKLGQKK